MDRVRYIEKPFLSWPNINGRGTSKVHSNAKRGNEENQANQEKDAKMVYCLTFNPENLTIFPSIRKKVCHANNDLQQIPGGNPKARQRTS